MQNNKSQGDSDEETLSDRDPEDEFQKEVDKIIDRVSNLDLGDVVSNKGM